MSRAHLRQGWLGVFDSGVGGLTVVRALRQALPHERLIYLGDTARVPYGSRSAAAVTRYARGCAHFLASRGAKLIVCACNTASAHALADLQAALPIPIVGVIDPGAAAAVAASGSMRIGVICTEGTRASGSYSRAIHALAPDAHITTLACPLLVPLAEEGWQHHAQATRLIIEAYLAPMARANIDVLVLGCTHYLLLAPALAACAGPGVTLVDGGTAVAQCVAEELANHHLTAPKRLGDDLFFATDFTSRLRRVGSDFLQAPLPEVQLVVLPEG